jgi:hypothetical protein
MYFFKNSYSKKENEMEKKIIEENLQNLVLQINIIKNNQLDMNLKDQLIHDLKEDCDSLRFSNEILIQQIGALEKKIQFK